MRTSLFVAVAGIAVAAVAAVSLATGPGSSSRARKAPLRVVAAENFWGSIAAQLGGTHAKVVSVITNPATDPHDYEPTAADARAMADAQIAIVNGIGYDPWADRLLEASPARGRVILRIGDLVGIRPGGNPHRWYSPGDVQRFIHRIERDYETLDPDDAAYFRAREQGFEAHGLAGYKSLISTIDRRFRNAPVGASESIFVPLAHALGLRLLTPPAFTKAISEGTDPSVADLKTISRQISHRQIRVWIFNSQNSTPDVKRITDAALAAGIQVVTITETLSPASATFQAWQSRQLRALERALTRATGR
jgi:zinc/manganese transport system substrate-binding protein